MLFLCYIPKLSKDVAIFNRWMGNDNRYFLRLLKDDANVNRRYKNNDLQSTYF